MTPLITEGLSREYWVARTKSLMALRRVFGELDELDAGAIQRGDLGELADVAVSDPALDDHGTVAEREPEIVQRIELEGERGLDLGPAEADVQDGHGLEDHDFPLDFPFKWDTLAVPLLAGHIDHLIGAELVPLQRADNRVVRRLRVDSSPSVPPPEHHG